MRSLIKTILLAGGAGAVFVLAFVGGIHVLENLGGEADCGAETCGPEPASIVSPAAAPRPAPRTRGPAGGSDFRIVGVDRDIAAAAPRDAASPAPSFDDDAPDPAVDLRKLPATPAVVDYALGLPDGLAVPGAEPTDTDDETGLPSDLLRGVDSILADEAPGGAGEEPVASGDGPIQLIAQPLAAPPAPKPIAEASSLSPPPIPVGRPSVVPTQEPGGGLSAGGRQAAGSGAAGAAGGTVGSVLGN